MNETEYYGKYGQGYIYPNNGMYHAGFITDDVINDIKEVWEEEGRPDGDLKTFIENNSYDLDLDEDGETIYGYDFASFDEAERWVNQQLKSSRNASKKRKATKRIAFDTDLGSGLVLDDKSDGILPVDIIFRKSDEREDDVYGPYVVIDEEGYTIGDVLRTPVKFVNTGYTATYFSNPRGEGIYGGNIDLSEKDDQATFETKEEAIEWAKGKLLNTSRYASKKLRARSIES